MISIVIPLYNKRKTIKKTVESILSQTYSDLEVIVVDDGSTDGGYNEIKKFNGRIKYIKQEHQGANAARNNGARMARGKYLFFCDADIILRDDALEILKEALDKNLDTSYSYSSFKLGWKKFASQQFDAMALKKFNYISTMSLIRKEDFVGFDKDLKKFQDWDLWLTMLDKGMVGVHVSQILFYAKPSRHGKSKWFPSFFYKVPWKKFGIKIKALQNYQQALDIIKKKHNLE